MNCKHGKDIERFLEGRLDEEKEKLIIRHAEECEECSERLKHSERIDMLIKGEMEQFPFESMRDSIMGKAQKKNFSKLTIPIIFNFKKYSLGVAAVFIMIASVFLAKSLINNQDIMSKKRQVNNASVEAKQSFEIYLVKPESREKALSYGSYEGVSLTKYIEGKPIDLDSLALEKVPVITDKDISCYYWNIHEIEFTKEFINKRNTTSQTRSSEQNSSELNLKSFVPEQGFKGEEYGGSRILDANTHEAFVVVVNGKRIYAGGFQQPPNTLWTPCEIGIRDVSNNRIWIWNNKKSYDPRTDKEIYNFFKMENKLDTKSYSTEEGNETVAEYAKRLEEFKTSVSSLASQSLDIQYRMVNTPLTDVYSNGFISKIQKEGNFYKKDLNGFIIGESKIGIKEKIADSFLFYVRVKDLRGEYIQVIHFARENGKLVIDDIEYDI